MTSFVRTAITAIVAEADRLLERAILRLWMANLREQLQHERAELY